MAGRSSLFLPLLTLALMTIAYLWVYVRLV